MNRAPNRPVTLLASLLLATLVAPLTLASRALADDSDSSPTDGARPAPSVILEILPAAPIDPDLGRRLIAWQADFELWAAPWLDRWHKLAAQRARGPSLGRRSACRELTLVLESSAAHRPGRSPDALMNLRLERSLFQLRLGLEACTAGRDFAADFHLSLAADELRQCLDRISVYRATAF